MLRSEKQKAIAISCYSMVSSMFASMTNRYNHGPNFSWDTFAESMSIFGRNNILLQMKVKPNERAETQDLAEKLSLMIAANLVDLMNK
jgi:hypothetical protein